MCTSTNQHLLAHIHKGALTQVGQQGTMDPPLSLSQHTHLAQYIHACLNIFLRKSLCYEWSPFILSWKIMYHPLIISPWLNTHYTHTLSHTYTQNDFTWRSPSLTLTVYTPVPVATFSLRLMEPGRFDITGLYRSRGTFTVSVPELVLGGWPLSVTATWI